jgi:thioredoxin 1
MRRLAITCLTLLAITLAIASNAQSATTWKLVLKNGRVIECDGAPLVVNDVYMFRKADGKDYGLAVDQVDREKTDQLNKVDQQQWRALDGAAAQPASASPSGNRDSRILTVRDADFNARVLQSETPVMVEFVATWCGYCTLFEPTVQSIASEYAGRVTVAKMDIDRSPATASRYGVDGTPTVILFKAGKAVGTIDGYVPKSEVLRMLRARI